MAPSTESNTADAQLGRMSDAERAPSPRNQSTTDGASLRRPVVERREVVPPHPVDVGTVVAREPGRDLLFAVARTPERGGSLPRPKVAELRRGRPRPVRPIPSWRLPTSSPAPLAPTIVAPVFIARTQWRR